MQPFRIAGWKIWYGDGTTFSSNNGRAADAPRKGILHIFYAFEPNGHMSGYVLTGVEAYPMLDIGDEMTPGMIVSSDEYRSTMKKAALALHDGVEEWKRG